MSLTSLLELVLKCLTASKCSVWKGRGFLVGASRFNHTFPVDKGVEELTRSHCEKVRAPDRWSKPIEVTQVFLGADVWLEGSILCKCEIEFCGAHSSAPRLDLHDMIPMCNSYLANQRASPGAMDIEQRAGSLLLVRSLAMVKAGTSWADNSHNR